jgi:hypothetical protein
LLYEWKLFHVSTVRPSPGQIPPYLGFRFQGGGGGGALEMKEEVTEQAAVGAPPLRHAMD